MSKCILIAEDNPAIREYCRAEFEDEGYRVLLAGDGAEAVSLFDRYHPDVVVLDILMPVMTGLETLEHIRRRQAHAPVILFTAFDEDCERDDRGTLATACVEKSGDLSELKRSVTDALRSITAQGNSLPGRTGLPPVDPQRRDLSDSSTNIRPDPAGNPT